MNTQTDFDLHRRRLMNLIIRLLDGARLRHPASIAAILNWHGIETPRVGMCSLSIDDPVSGCVVHLNKEHMIELIYPAFALDTVPQFPAGIFVTYAIVDPVCGQTIYIGQTGDFEQRKISHLRKGWIRPRTKGDSIRTRLHAMFLDGIEPVFVALETAGTLEESLASETRLIAHFARMGSPLANGTEEHLALIRDCRPDSWS